MFRRLREPAAPVALRVDGRAVTAAAGDTVAAALLAADIPLVRRAPAGGAPRGPYCLMGVCFDCTVTIAGLGAVQACLTRVEDGMVVATAAERTGTDGEAGA